MRFTKRYRLFHHFLGEKKRNAIFKIRQSYSSSRIFFNYFFKFFILFLPTILHFSKYHTIQIVNKVQLMSMLLSLFVSSFVTRIYSVEEATAGLDGQHINHLYPNIFFCENIIFSYLFSLKIFFKNFCFCGLSLF